MPELVTVASFVTPWEACVVCGLLESEGVPAWLASEHHVWIDWPLSQALGGVRIQVRACDVGLAAEVLAARRAGEYQAALEQEQALGRPVCDRCGSTAFRETPAMASVLASFVGWLLAAPSPVHQRIICASCGTPSDA